MKNRTSLFPALLLALALAGCGAEAPSVPPAESEAASSAGRIVPSAMLQKAADTPLTDGKNIIEAASAGDFLYAMNLESIAPRSDEIIEATVNEIDYAAFDGLPWARINVNVDSVVYGGLSSGDCIDIYVYGGYMPLRDFIEYHDVWSRFDHMTMEEIENSVYYAPKENEDLPIENEQYLFFLQDSVSVMPADTFQRLGQKFCTYHIEDDGETLSHVPLEPDAGPLETVSKTELYAQIAALLSSAR